MPLVPYHGTLYLNVRQMATLASWPLPALAFFRNNSPAHAFIPGRDDKRFPTREHFEPEPEEVST